MARLALLEASLRHLLAPLLLALTCLCAPATAQETPPPNQAATPAPSARTAVKVGLVPISPFAVKHEDGTYTGFDVELWEAIGEESGFETTFVPRASLEELLGAVEKGEVDVALGAITITAPREVRLDFSHQYIRSGLQIMVPPATQHSATRTIASNLFQAKNLPWLLSGLAFIAVSALLAWWSERGVAESCFSDDFNPGFFEAIYWTIVTMSTVGYGDYAPRRPLGRLVAVLVIFSGISVYGTLIAKGASLMTVDQLQHEIQGPEDLPGKRVATVKGSTSADVLRDLGAVVVGVPEIEQAYPLLQQGKADAVVFDAPTLQHHCHGAGAGKAFLAGPLFEVQHYGFVFSSGSSLRERVNCSLLRLRRNGVYEKLHKRYFGE